MYIWWIGWQVTLMESMNKRCVFLEHVIGRIGLTNVQVERGRAEVLSFFWSFDYDVLTSFIAFNDVFL